MNSAVLYCTVILFYLFYVSSVLAESHDEHSKHTLLKNGHLKHIHQKSAEVHHRHHSRHIHKGLATRDSNSTVNSTLCISSTQPELIALIRWLNNTNDLQLLYNLTPPSIRREFSGTYNATITNSTNTTLLNGTFSIDLDHLYNASNSEFRIIEYFSRVFGIIFNVPGSLATEFGTRILRTFIQAFFGSSNNTEALFDNIRRVFSFNNSLINGNGTNLTSFTQWLSPSNFITNVENVEHTIEGGINGFVRNFSNFFG